ncbi:MAG: polysaccharide deacetylase family protein [Bacteroidia bacterium]
MSKPVPILYYHSVADHNRKRVWSFLSCPVRIFEKQMAWLAKNGWYTCHWEEFSDHLEGKKALPEKSVLLHFDDGFLDNWTVAHPIMEKYGIKYSVLLTPDFIEQNNRIRPQSPQTPEAEMYNWWGYLSKGEIQKMVESGLADFQAHGATHTWYPSSDEIVDVYDGSQTLPHLLWNVFPEAKPLWLERFPGGIIEGYPVFAHTKSLANKRAFLPNKDFTSAAIKAYDPKRSKAENLANVQQLADDYRKRDALGRYETDDERMARITTELLGTRENLEDITGKPVQYLVYPGGGHTPETDELAFEFGYKLLSKGTTPNAFGSKLKHVQRFTGYYPFKPAGLSYRLNMLLLRFQLRRGQGNRLIHAGINMVKRFV